MNNIAQRLVQPGNQQSCYKIYSDSHGSAIQMSLWKLGVGKLCKDDVQKMQWEALEAKIGDCIHFMRIVIVKIPGNPKVLKKKNLKVVSKEKTLIVMKIKAARLCPPVSCLWRVDRPF